MLLRRLGAAVLVLGLLVGCGDDEQEPEPLPPVASATASPSASPAAVPSQAAAETPEAAAAFARFWFDTLNAAARAGDTAALRGLAAPGCKACEAFAMSIEDLYGAGGRIEGGVFSVVAAEAPALPAGATEARVTVVYDVTPTRQIGADGRELASTPALKAVDGDMRLVRVADQWRVAELSTA